MNGEVNGTMEKPNDDSVPNSSDDLQNEKKVASDECCDNATNLSENSNNTEDSNHLDGENSQECSTNSNTENLVNDNSNGSEIQEHDIQLSPKVSENENSNSIFLVNNCGNSNESYTESVNSSQAKSDITDQPVLHIIDESKAGEPSRLFAKTTTSITRITEIVNDENNCGNSNESCHESPSISQVKSDSTDQQMMHIIDVKTMEEPPRLFTKGSTSITRITQITKDESNCGNNSNESYAESIASSQSKPDSPEQPQMHIIDVKSIGEPPRLYHKGSTSITRISQIIQDESNGGNNSNESLAESIASSQAKLDSPEQPVIHIIDERSIEEPPRLYHKGMTSISRITQIVKDESNCGNNSNESYAESVASSQSKPDSPEHPQIHIIDVKSIGEPPRLYHKGSTSITRISQIIQDESNCGNHSNESHADSKASSQAKPDSPEQPQMHIIDVKSIGEPPRLYHKGSTSITRISQTIKDKNNGNSSESYTESMNNSQTKSDSPEQPLMHIVDVKSIGEPPRLCHKGMTRIIEIIKDENSETDSEDTSSSAQDIFIGPPRPEDTVSINSDDTDLEGAEDLSQEGMIKISNSNIIILENEGSLSQNGNSNDSPSPDIQEITSDNDDCVMAEENEVIDEEKEKENTNDSDKKVQLRRSSRAIKRKRYNDDIENGNQESDLEEVAMDTSFHRKNKPIVINDTKALVEMAARQMKSNQSHSHKKEPTVVIIDTNSLGTGKSTFPHKPSGLTISSSLSAQSLYQSIVARGTTVTPVSSKSSVATQSSTQVSGQSSSQAAQTAQPLILPSLTDDMFVVEAPSFIVPYVYEKPSVKPFREFVDRMGKELDEQKAKEEKELQEKATKEKDKKEKEKQEKKEKGDDVEESEDEASPASPPSASNETRSNEPSEEKKKKKKDKRKRGDEDDVSWDGETSTDSEDEILMSDDENKTVIIKDKVDSLGEIKDVTELTVDKVCSNKTDNYFDCSIGKFFINIGLSLVQEYVQSDLLKQQNRKLNREKKTGHSTKSTEASIASLMKNIEFSKENNVPYSFTQTKCEFCSFKTESKLAMAHHLETPHMKNNIYKCNFCPFEIRSPHDILYHMEAEHNIRGKLERAPAYHQCANCPFEDNGKGKLARHLIPCAKKFKPELNLAPPLEWEPPAKIPKIARSRNNMMTSYHNSFNRSHLGSNLGRAAMNVPSIMPGVSSSYRPRNRTPMAVSARAVPVQGAPILRGGVIVRHNAPVLLSSNYPVANNAKKTVHQPSISITPLPRQPQPVQPVQPIPVQPMPVQPQPSHNSKNTFVICEICDGYIKDLEQLRNHMQWIHKVKIHPKMIYNRPPLNCQKCQFRFFTDQGLERHLLGSHGLVTSSMQEAANKGKDAGRCPVCGRVYQWKLLNHVARDHNLTLKPAHLSYKCTVCTATFGMYKQFLNHVYSAHSVVAKRVMDKSKGSAPKTNSDSLLKPLKINDEITIIPQPVKSAPAPADDTD